MTVQIGYKEPALRPIIFGDLCLLERISIGGMAEVYRAKPLEAPEFDRLLAVKRILPNLAEDDEFVQMFVAEAKIAIRLHHPNIAQIYELGKRGSSHYIVMEYVAGHDLLRLQHWHKLRRRPLDLGLSSYIVRCVADALGHAHDHTTDDGQPAPVIHRDVSPANVLISYGGDVKLIDFGIAKIAGRSTGTQVGVLKGKFSYMSPEQVAGRPLDPRADLFSLGIVFHELLTGERLFASANDFETLQRVRDARVEPPSHLNEAVPYQLDNVVMRLLARDPDARYPDAGSLIEVLDELLAELSTPFGHKGHEALSDFMVRAFADDLARERRRRERYAAFVTADDVVAHNERILAEITQAAEAHDIERRDESEVETTRVAEADYDRLLAELDEGELEKGKEGQVLAESRLGRLSKLLARSDAMLASMDLPEPRAADLDEHREEMFRPHRERTRRGWLLTILGAALVAAAVGLWLLRPGPPGVTESSAPGMLMLEVEPADGLQVFLDDRLVGTSTPLVLRGLEPGEHVLELRHPDYQTYRETMTVPSGRAVEHRVVLAEPTRGVGLVDLHVEPPDAEVWLDGALLEGANGRRSLQLEARASHVIEVRRRGYVVEERRLELAAGTHDAMRIALEPVDGRLVVRSEPPGRVIIDGEPRGSNRGGLVLGGLDPTVPHGLRIVPSQPGFLPYETLVVFDGLRELNLFATLRRIGDPPPVDPAPVGFLAVRTGERWYRLIVDGRETGLTTPIAEEAPLALRAGVREVRLVRGDDQHVITVEVAPGATATVDCRPPDWACDI